MSSATRQTVGRYALHDQIASGGMATVHVGRLMGPVGFARTVAIKRLHSHFANDPEFVAMFMDEAHLAARIRHPNVVSISDVVAERGELLLVMDYVAGEALSKLVRSNRRRGQAIDPRIVVKIITDALAGLHAAHEVRDDDAQLLGVVHRDVSPQNILVGVDGVTQLIDFGVAKAAGRIQTTREGQLKGKLGYMPPEQIQHGVVDRRTDIYSAAVVAWEALTGERLFKGEDANLMYEVLHAPVVPPSHLRKDLPAALDAVVMRGLARDPQERFATALDFADALEDAVPPASSREVARWVQATGAEALRSRSDIVADMESDSALYAEMPTSARPSSAQPHSAQLNSEQPHSAQPHSAQPYSAQTGLSHNPRAAAHEEHPTLVSDRGVGVGRAFKPLHLLLALAGLLVAGVVLALGIRLVSSGGAAAEGAAADGVAAPTAPIPAEPTQAAQADSVPTAAAAEPAALAETEPESAEGAETKEAPPPSTAAPAKPAAPSPAPAAKPKPKTPPNPAGLSEAERKAKYGF